MRGSEELAKQFGYLTQDETAFLTVLAMSLDERPVIVNIGAGAGTSALALREARPDSYLISVDVSPGGPLGGFEGERNAFDEAGLPYPIQILGDSHLVGKLFYIPADLIFVDADHTQPGIEGDIDAWLHNMKKGCIVVFHDYTRKFWPDVKEVVDRRMSMYRLISQVDTTIAFRMIL